MTRVRLSSGEVLDANDLEPARVRPPPPMPTPMAAAPTSAPMVKLSPRSDVEILDAILSATARLTLRERDAFAGMRHRVAYGLSYAQRSWAQEVAARLGFDVTSPTGWRDTHDAVRAIPYGCKRIHLVKWSCIGKTHVSYCTDEPAQKKL